MKWVTNSRKFTLPTSFHNLPGKVEKILNSKTKFFFFFKKIISKYFLKYAVKNDKEVKYAQICRKMDEKHQKYVTLHILSKKGVQKCGHTNSTHNLRRRNKEKGEGKKNWHHRVKSKQKIWDGNSLIGQGGGVTIIQAIHLDKRLILSFYNLIIFLIRFILYFLNLKLNNFSFHWIFRVSELKFRNKLDEKNGQLGMG